MARGLLSLPAADPVQDIERDIAREHAIIGRVLDGAEMLMQRMRRREPIPTAIERSLLEFLTAFVEGVHRAKEERALADPRLAGTAPEVRRDHAEGRVLLAALAANPREVDRWAAYIAFKRRHMSREEHALGALWDGLVDDPVRGGAVRAAFAAVDSEIGGPARAALLHLAEAIEVACREEPAAHGAGGNGARVVRDVMRTRVGGIDPAAPLARAVDTMDLLGVRELPVVDMDGMVVGILTRGDLLPHQGHFEWTQVKAAMTADPTTIGPDASLVDATRQLVRQCWNALPVVEGGRLVGMIGRADVLRALAGEPDPES